MDLPQLLNSDSKMHAYFSQMLFRLNSPQTQPWTKLNFLSNFFLVDFDQPGFDHFDKMQNVDGILQQIWHFNTKNIG